MPTRPSSLALRPPPGMPGPSTNQSSSMSSAPVVSPTPYCSQKIARQVSYGKGLGGTWPAGLGPIGAVPIKPWNMKNSRPSALIIPEPSPTLARILPLPVFIAVTSRRTRWTGIFSTYSPLRPEESRCFDSRRFVESVCSAL